MTARYVSLTGASDWLAGEATLNTNSKARAEAEADHFIDAQLQKWDRSAWQGAAVPPEVASIALKYASAEYHRLRFAKASPDGTMPDIAKTLFQEAKDAVADIKARGFIVDVDGVQVAPVDAGSGSSIFVEIHV